MKFLFRSPQLSCCLPDDIDRQLQIRKKLKRNSKPFSALMPQQAATEFTVFRKRRKTAERDSREKDTESQKKSSPSSGYSGAVRRQCR